MGLIMSIFNRINLDAELKKKYIKFNGQLLSKSIFEIETPILKTRENVFLDFIIEIQLDKTRSINRDIEKTKIKIKTKNKIDKMNTF
jgi:hypothetical protein